MALSSIPAGVSLQRVGDRAVAFVRDGDRVTAFLPAIPRGDALVWCESDGVFATALQASRYSLEGERLSGPGPERLARYATRVEGPELVVSASHPFDMPQLRWTDALASQFTAAAAGVCG